MEVDVPLGHTAVATRSPDERRKDGAALRGKTPRSQQAEWTPPADRADPVGILIEQGKSRIQELLPIRYARMRTDPFAFLRGAAAVMAADLARTPVAGIRMQACGDAHLANFGSYATPEGTPVFDLNDFDETLPAPFEWDLKRLATSLVVAARVAQYSEKAACALARTAAQSYREHMGAGGTIPDRRLESSYRSRPRHRRHRPHQSARFDGEAPRPGAEERRCAFRLGGREGWQGRHP